MQCHMTDYKYVNAILRVQERTEESKRKTKCWEVDTYTIDIHMFISPQVWNISTALEFNKQTKFEKYQQNANIEPTGCHAMLY